MLSIVFIKHIEKMLLLFLNIGNLGNFTTNKICCLLVNVVLWCLLSLLVFLLLIAERCFFLNI